MLLCLLSRPGCSCEPSDQPSLLPCMNMQCDVIMRGWKRFVLLSSFITLDEVVYSARVSLSAEAGMGANTQDEQIQDRATLEEEEEEVLGLREEDKGTGHTVIKTRPWVVLDRSRPGSSSLLSAPDSSPGKKKRGLFLTEPSGCVSAVWDGSRERKRGASSLQSCHRAQQQQQLQEQGKHPITAATLTRQRSVGEHSAAGSHSPEGRR
ncbi:PREDICTED: uncharacterized protein LOC106916531 isoform X2 [Poecilia mexicana]|uniref:uncharacterized protein LOC106916531 isoform X2 n=1 Tax=Poecilia mexicana TaxID=48701 RepID=UPI00072DCDDC|nr:PREDICTED: uncharacterized protein LOC106916531 isoform X2 [Poecilia mexicana]